MKGATKLLLRIFFFTFATILILPHCIDTFAQETLRVGDVVEVADGSTWVQGRIESIQGSIIKVRTGPGKYDFRNYQWPTPQIRPPGTAAREARDTDLRNSFRKEASNYYETLKMFAHFYDDKYLPGGAPRTAADWQRVMSELAELDAICKSKYALLTNVPPPHGFDRFDDNLSDWCKIAARRSELEKPARMSLAKNQVTLTLTTDNLNFAFNHQKNRVPDETQMLMYDRAKWKEQQILKYQPRFAEYGIEMPADFFADVETKADELKQLIEKTAPNRTWEQPSFHDPAVEAFVRGKFAADPDYRGVKILKSGVDYNTWVERKSLAYLGSDSSYRYYKVEYNSYKRGWVLMKLPTQPFCQASEWIVGRGAKGMVVVSLGGSGIFMKCQ
jgi:hypothetical protein